jgi:hypothetical protein
LGVELGQEALSVTTLAVPLAKYLGCGPILFCGVDLSYKNLQRYPPGVTPSSRVFLEDLEQERRSMEKLVRKKNGEGKFVYTLVKWVMEAACLGAYAKTHPESAFFQSSLSGLPIASTSYLPIEQFAHQFCVKEYDLRGQLHAVMEGALLADVSDKKVHEAFDLLAVSLERCIPLVQELLVEIERKHLKPFSGEGDWQSGRMQVLEMDIMEEPGYEVCLASILVMYRKILQRRYPDSSFIDPEKSYRQKLAKERKIWQECLVAIDRCVSTLRRSMV